MTEVFGGSGQARSCAIAGTTCLSLLEEGLGAQKRGTWTARSPASCRIHSPLSQPGARREWGRHSACSQHCVTCHSLRPVAVPGVGQRSHLYAEKGTVDWWYWSEGDSPPLSLPAGLLLALPLFTLTGGNGTHTLASTGLSLWPLPIQTTSKGNDGAAGDRVDVLPRDQASEAQPCDRHQYLDRMLRHDGGHFIGRKLRQRLAGPTITKASQTFNTAAWASYNAAFLRQAANRGSLHWGVSNPALCNEAFAGRAKVIPQCHYCMGDMRAF